MTAHITGQPDPTLDPFAPPAIIVGTNGPTLPDYRDHPPRPDDTLTAWLGDPEPMPETGARPADEPLLDMTIIDPDATQTQPVPGPDRDAQWALALVHQLVTQGLLVPTEDPTSVSIVHDCHTDGMHIFLVSTAPGSAQLVTDLADALGKRTLVERLRTRGGVIAPPRT